MNNLLAQTVVEACIRLGVEEFCVAPGSRNAPLVYALSSSNQVKVYYWSEERSAAFFALGKIKSNNKPVAIVTTSGTAAAELLPAAMSGHYLGLPLLMITADRPRRYRETGAPQTAEQMGLFGRYAHFEIDAAGNELIDLSGWSLSGPAHLNVCFEEPSEVECQKILIQKDIPVTRNKKRSSDPEPDLGPFIDFIEAAKTPLVILGSLPLQCREVAIQFLLKLNAPVYAECCSHLREDARLDGIRILHADRIWRTSTDNGYSIDAVLRVGEIPTARLWRDLEEQASHIPVYSVSALPFPGLTRSSLLCMSLDQFFRQASELHLEKAHPFHKWLKFDREFHDKLLGLFLEEPQAEPSLFHVLSSHLPKESTVYLGNSLPIREWDLAATRENRGYQVHASRGVNGIDGQVSTFLGLSQSKRDNWGILGDLTLLYDLAGPWILPQLPNHSVNLVVVNNGGGQIFSQMYSMPEFINPHALQFEHLAAFWNMNYEKWTQIPSSITNVGRSRLIEILPNAAATERFYKKMSRL